MGASVGASVDVSALLSVFVEAVASVSVCSVVVISSEEVLSVSFSFPQPVIASNNENITESNINFFICPPICLISTFNLK